MKPYLIVSTDGGGMRGAYPCTIMCRLDEEVPGWRSHVSLWSGTSTGALLAGGLAAGLPPRTLLEFYTDFGSVIFKWGIGERFKDGWGTIAARYSSDGLFSVLRGAFGEKRMGDVGPLVVSTFALDKKTEWGRMWGPKIFENVTGDDSNDAGALLLDVLLASASAPVYFPSWKGYVDGGVCGSPALIAYAQACDSRNREPVDRAAISLLSLGTGRMPYYKAGDPDRGILQYGVDLITMPLAGAGETGEWALDRQLGARKHRVQHTLPQAWPMDDYEVTPETIAWARSVDISDTVAWLRETIAG